MDTLPDIHEATALFKDTKELLQQVSVDLSEERSCWSISLTCSDLGGENYHANHELYKRLFRAKQGDKPVKITIEFQESEMNLEQAQLFMPDAGEAAQEQLAQFDAENAEWDKVGESTTEGAAPDADGIVRRTYMVNGVEHEYSQASTEPEDGEGSPEQQTEFKEAAADGAPSEFQEPPTTRRRRGATAAEASE